MIKKHKDKSQQIHVNKSVKLLMKMERENRNKAKVQLPGVSYSKKELMRLIARMCDREE